MLIIKQPPKIYKLIKNKFKVQYEDVVIAYYPNIYVKEGKLPFHKLTHEKVHLERQKEIGVEEWWNRYLNIPMFRLDEELRAYRAEIKDIIESNMSKVYKEELIEQLLKDLTGEMYGSIIDYDTAKIMLNIPIFI